MTRSPWEPTRNIWRESNAPLTLSIIIAAVVLFLLDFLRLPLGAFLAFEAPRSLIQPWRLLTYPLVVPHIIGLLFYGLMLWWVGASLERSWGTPFYAVFWAAMAIITALSMSFGALVLGVTGGGFFVSYWLPLSAIVFAWCILNPNQEIRLYGIIPVLGKWLAVGTAAIIFFLHATPHPLMGVFALMGCGAAFWWVRTRSWAGVDLYSSMPIWRWGEGRSARPRASRLRLVKSDRPRDDRFSWRDLNPFEFIARRRRRKKLERLLDD